MVKDHPRIGYEILKKIEFQAPVATIVLQHYENLNGTGYPSGLFGNKILIEARIILVADSLEAMTSPRTFRLAYSLSDALEELSRQSGILYDSNVVKACKSLF